MKQLLATIILTIGLAACQTTQPVYIIKEVPVLVEVPDNLYRCPEIRTFPDPDTLTDGQVADLLLQYAKNNKSCAASLAQIKAFLAKSKETLANEQE